MDYKIRLALSMLANYAKSFKSNYFEGDNKKNLGFMLVKNSNIDD
jgi:hypothetical protein